MKYKIFSDEKLFMLGQDAVAIIIKRIMVSGLLEEFCDLLLRVDSSKELSARTKFNKEFIIERDADYILFHLVMFTSTLLKIYAGSYVMDKKLFGGYKSNLYRAFNFNYGLEKGLKEFRGKGKFKSINQIKADTIGDKITYFQGDYLSETMPYFEHTLAVPTLNVLENITIKFCENLAYIREPQDVAVPATMFSIRSEELLHLKNKLMYDIFIE